MCNFIDSSFRGVIPEDEIFDFEGLNSIDNKLKGVVMESLGMVIKINTGTSKGKVYLRIEDVTRFLEDQGNKNVHLASREQLKKMMINVMENSNLKAFFKENHTYFDCKLYTTFDKLYTIQETNNELDQSHSVDSLSEENNVSLSGDESRVSLSNSEIQNKK